MNKDLLALAFLSELHLFLASIGLVYDDLKVFTKDKVSFSSFLTGTFFSIIIFILRCVTFFVIVYLIFLCAKLTSFKISMIVNIIWGVYIYRIVLLTKKKKDFGVIDSVICVVCFMFLLYFL